MRLFYLTLCSCFLFEAHAQAPEKTDFGFNGVWKQMAGETYKNGKLEPRFAEASLDYYVIIHEWSVTEFSLGKDSAKRFYHEPLEIVHAFDDSMYDVSFKPKFIELRGWSNGDGIVRNYEVVYQDDSTISFTSRWFDYDSTSSYVGTRSLRKIGEIDWAPKILRDTLLNGDWKATMMMDRSDKWVAISRPWMYELRIDTSQIFIDNTYPRWWIANPDSVRNLKRGDYGQVNTGRATILYMLGGDTKGETTSAMLHIIWIDNDNFWLSVSERFAAGGCYRMTRVDAPK